MDVISVSVGDVLEGLDLAIAPLTKFVPRGISKMNVHRRATEGSIAHSAQRARQSPCKKLRSCRRNGVPRRKHQVQLGPRVLRQPRCAPLRSATLAGTEAAATID